MSVSAPASTPTSKPEIIEITDDNFEELALRSPVPVLIDFTAPWCAPCRMIAPHIHAIAAAYSGRLRVATCDADANAKLCAQLDVRAMPTLMVFREGRVVAQVVGALPRAKLEAMVQRALA
jgi:thioredoxin 1